MYSARTNFLAFCGEKYKSAYAMSVSQKSENHHERREQPFRFKNKPSFVLDTRLFFGRIFFDFKWYGVKICTDVRTLSRSRVSALFSALVEYHVLARKKYENGGAFHTSPKRFPLPSKGLKPASPLLPSRRGSFWLFVSPEKRPPPPLLGWYCDSYPSLTWPAL